MPSEPARRPGNPAAVVLDGTGLDTIWMQPLAGWLNVAETTFVLPADDPDADYRVGIFTVAQELPDRSGDTGGGSCSRRHETRFA